jgi:hypothetical protein
MPFIYMESGDKALLAGESLCIWKKPATDAFGPYTNPEDHLNAVFFHSDFDYYAVAASANVAVNHAAYAAATPAITRNYYNAVRINIYWPYQTTTRVLFNHNLGYVPKFLIADEDYHELPAGVPIQYFASENGGVRFDKHYATATQIIQEEVACPGLDPLPAISKTYRIVVFRDPAADPAKPMFQGKGSEAIFGRGKIVGSEKSLRRALAGETAFSMPTGRIYDIANGQVRYVRGDGFWIESKSVRGSTIISYDGSFTGSDFLSVVA